MNVVDIDQPLRVAGRPVKEAGWVAHKFGGSSLVDAECIREVTRLLLEREESHQLVVVSAMARVTSGFIELAEVAAEGGDWRGPLGQLRLRHQRCLLALDEANTCPQIDREFDQLEHLLHSLALMGSAPQPLVDRIAGVGEVCSAQLLAASLRRRQAEAVVVDAREVLWLRPAALTAAVDWPRSAAALQAFCERNPAQRYVITGYVCRAGDGAVATLGRNGSDFSASIFASLFQAKELHIWSDVDGLLSADPGHVNGSVAIERLSYREAFELAYFGARVIYPQSLVPAMQAGIPVQVRNTFRPQHPGTRIDAEGDPNHPVKGVSGLGGMALVTLEGSGMLGVPGTAERVFSALHQAGVSVSLISQGSSEQSICLAVPEALGTLACKVLEQAFERELRHGQVQRIECQHGVRLMSVVGDGMAGTPGIAARVFSSLAEAGVNVRAIAQGGSERNISVAVAEADAARALRAVHAGFYLSRLTVSLAIIGPGQVGRALLCQILAARERLRAEAGLDLRLRAVASSRHMRLFDESPDNQQQALPTDQDAATCLDALIEHVDDAHCPHALVIDCTASDSVAEHYEAWLARGVHVITPNKMAGSGDIDRHARLRSTLAGSAARWRYEATVGAGLPVVQTLRDLLDTGDSVERIEGVLSGTLAFLFNRFEPGMAFSQLVAEARDQGYTEPHPASDLSGMDVARKLVILAREMGMALRLEDIDMEPLAPPEWEALAVPEFLHRLESLDAAMSQRLQQAMENNQVLRYVASLDAASGKARVALEALPLDHPFAHLALTDNIVAFRSARYDANPLVVQGPGAGPEVTAAGVFADLLRVASSLGARL